MRVLVVDDQDLVRAGLVALLDLEEDIEVVGEAGDGLQALVLARQLRPDVVLMDIRMPTMDGIEATRRLSSETPASKVLILTTFDLDAYVYAALAAGASGFLLKDTPRAQLIAGVRTVMAGDCLVAPSVTRRLVEHYVARPPHPDDAQARLAGLTTREAEVLRAVASGRSNAEVAQQLYLSEATVKTHMAHILTKLGLRDRVQAVVFAYESGLVRPQAPGGGARGSR